MTDSLTWRREPFYGGCAYHADQAPITVRVFYALDQFEQESPGWIVGNVSFDSTEQAFAAAESLWRYLRNI